MEDIVFSNLATKYGSGPCCEETVSFNMCDCDALGVSCSGGPQTNWITAFGFSDDWIFIGVYTLAPASYTAMRCVHSDDPYNCVSNGPPTLAPMASACRGANIGDPRAIDDYRFGQTSPTGNCPQTLCPDGRCQPIGGKPCPS